MGSGQLDVFRDQPRDLSGVRDLPDPTPEARAVWGIMVWHRGRKNSIKSREIETRLEINGSDVRESMHWLVVVAGKMIGSCRAGYYVIETDEELAHEAAALRGRAMAILVRMSRLTRRGPEEVLGQMVLEMKRGAEG